MAKIVAVANSKGGVGKTTIARNLALICQSNGLKTLALDCDPQKSLEAFFSARAERLDRVDLDCDVKTESTGLKRDILHRSEKYDRVIVDVGGRDSSTMRQVLLAADTVIIPTTTGQESTDALAYMIQAVEDVRGVNEDLKAFILINLAPSDPHDSTAPATAEGLAELYDEQAVVLKSRIKHRKAWLQSGFEGHAIWEMSNKAEDKATFELQQVVEELLEMEVF